MLVGAKFLECFSCHNRASCKESIVNSHQGGGQVVSICDKETDHQTTKMKQYLFFFGSVISFLLQMYFNLHITVHTCTFMNKFTHTMHRYGPLWTAAQRPHFIKWKLPILTLLDGHDSIGNGFFTQEVLSLQGQPFSFAHWKTL